MLSDEEIINNNDKSRKFMGSKEKDVLMEFEICGERISLQDYDAVIEKKKEILKDYLPFLLDFPYTIKKLKGDSIENIREVPVSIIYNGRKISLYGFIKENREFESQLKRITEINSLERIHEFGIVFTQLIQKDQYHATIIETFRVLQDLNYCLNTARFALMQANKILHYRSALVWSNGWEQLWTRSAWLNNAIILYNSCFDKIVQSVWIGFEAFDGYQKKKKGKPEGQPLKRQDLYSKEGLNRIYKLCDYNEIKNRFPSCINDIISPMFSNDFVKVREYANRIKHRGGMRYKDLFPYGNILEIVDDNCYSSFRTQIMDEIDNVVLDVKDYHNVFCNVVQEIFTYIMKEFNNHGYLKERINKVILCKNKENKDDEESTTLLESQSKSEKTVSM